MYKLGEKLPIKFEKIFYWSLDKMNRKKYESEKKAMEHYRYLKRIDWLERVIKQKISSRYENEEKDIKMGKRTNENDEYFEENILKVFNVNESISGNDSTQIRLNIFPSYWTLNELCNDSSDVVLILRKVRSIEIIRSFLGRLIEARQFTDIDMKEFVKSFQEMDTRKLFDENNRNNLALPSNSDEEKEKPFDDENVDEMMEENYEMKEEIFERTENENIRDKENCGGENNTDKENKKNGNETVENIGDNGIIISKKISEKYGTEMIKKLFTVPMLFYEKVKAPNFELISECVKKVRGQSVPLALSVILKKKNENNKKTTTSIQKDDSGGSRRPTRDCSKRSYRSDAVCDCYATNDGICGMSCVNRMLNVECNDENCGCGVDCSNRRFQRFESAPIGVVRTEKKGWGVIALEDLTKDSFIMEYVGEIIDLTEMAKRKLTYQKERIRHHYFMSLTTTQVIDATVYGNASRYMNHSCDPNCITSKWIVNGESRIAFITKRSITSGEELSFDYRFEVDDDDSSDESDGENQTISEKETIPKVYQKCYCGARNCRKWLGAIPPNGSKSRNSTNSLSPKRIRKPSSVDSHKSVKLDDKSLKKKMEMEKMNKEMAMKKKLERKRHKEKKIYGNCFECLMKDLRSKSTCKLFIFSYEFINCLILSASRSSCVKKWNEENEKKFERRLKDVKAKGERKRFVEVYLYESHDERRRRHRKIRLKTEKYERQSLLFEWHTDEDVQVFCRELYQSDSLRSLDRLLNSCLANMDDHICHSLYDYSFSKCFVHLLRRFNSFPLTISCKFILILSSIEWRYRPCELITAIRQIWFDPLTCRTNGLQDIMWKLLNEFTSWKSFTLITKLSYSDDLWKEFGYRLNILLENWNKLEIRFLIPKSKKKTLNEMGENVKRNDDGLIDFRSLMNLRLKQVEEQSTSCENRKRNCDTFELIHSINNNNNNCKRRREMDNDNNNNNVGTNNDHIDEGEKEKLRRNELSKLINELTNLPNEQYPMIAAYLARTFSPNSNVKRSKWSMAHELIFECIRRSQEEWELKEPFIDPKLNLTATTNLNRVLYLLQHNFITFYAHYKYLLKLYYLEEGLFRFEMLNYFESIINHSSDMMPMNKYVKFFVKYFCNNNLDELTECCYTLNQHWTNDKHSNRSIPSEEKTQSNLRKELSSCRSISIEQRNDLLYFMLFGNIEEEILRKIRIMSTFNFHEQNYYPISYVLEMDKNRVERAKKLRYANDLPISPFDTVPMVEGKDRKKNLIELKKFNRSMDQFFDENDDFLETSTTNLMNHLPQLEDYQKYYTQLKSKNMKELTDHHQLYKEMIKPFESLKIWYEIGEMNGKKNMENMTLPSDDDFTETYEIISINEEELIRESTCPSSTNKRRNGNGKNDEKNDKNLVKKSGKKKCESSLTVFHNTRRLIENMTTMVTSQLSSYDLTMEEKRNLINMRDVTKLSFDLIQKIAKKVYESEFIKYNSIRYVRIPLPDPSWERKFRCQFPSSHGHNFNLMENTVFHNTLPLKWNNGKCAASLNGLWCDKKKENPKKEEMMEVQLKSFRFDLTDTLEIIDDASVSFKILQTLKRIEPRRKMTTVNPNTASSVTATSITKSKINSISKSKNENSQSLIKSNLRTIKTSSIKVETRTGEKPEETNVPQRINEINKFGEIEINKFGGIEINKFGEIEINKLGKIEINKFEEIEKKSIIIPNESMTIICDSEIDSIKQPIKSTTTTKPKLKGLYEDQSISNEFLQQMKKENIKDNLLTSFFKYNPIEHEMKEEFSNFHSTDMEEMIIDEKLEVGKEITEKFVKNLLGTVKNDNQIFFDTKHLYRLYEEYEKNLINDVEQFSERRFLKFITSHHMFKGENVKNLNFKNVNEKIWKKMHPTQSKMDIHRVDEQIFQLENLLIDRQKRRGVKCNTKEFHHRLATLVYSKCTGAKPKRVTMEQIEQYLNQKELDLIETFRTSVFTYIHKLISKINTVMDEDELRSNTEFHFRRVYDIQLQYFLDSNYHQLNSLFHPKSKLNDRRNLFINFVLDDKVRTKIESYIRRNVEKA
ncbi:hypothetical protein SNEBB_011492 [Seison nebaliae]|nr:hypothetical protein SNEBB_011492 [Seison nebaliae]